MSEITKELFYTIINSCDRNTEVIKHENYTDVIYFKHGTRLIYRSNYISGDNYYIQDINI